MSMKNLFKFALLIPVLAGALMAFGPSSENEKKGVYVQEKDHDFGTVSEDGGAITAVFIVVNDTDEPILLASVKASCGCTSPSWTKDPIEPGKTGEIKATYNPKGRPGPFNKTITAITNTSERIVMTIKGTVE
jgi:hypothetical protein